MLSRRQFFAAIAALGGALVTPQEFAEAAAAAFRHVIRKNVLNIIEPTKGPWWNNNFWGDQHAQGVPESEGVTVEVLPKNNRMYGPPAVHSVALVRGDEIVAQNADVYASVTVGCGGIENNFRCDWLHGVQFSIVCNSLHVEAVSYAPSSLVGYNAVGAHIFLGAMVAKGTVNESRCPLTLTEPLAEVANNGVLDFPVPDFAREVIVHLFIEPATTNSNPATATGVIVRLTAAGAGKFAQYDAQVCAGGKSIPIPGGSTEVRIANTSGSTVLMSVQWVLGL